jgi:uncharacterized membrane protein
MLLQVVIVAVVFLTLLALLLFIWPRRESLRRLFKSGGAAGAGSYIGGDGYSPHASGGDGGGSDGGSGDC